VAGCGRISAEAGFQYNPSTDTIYMLVDSTSIILVISLQLHFMHCRIFDIGLDYLPVFNYLFGQ